MTRPKSPRTGLSVSLFSRILLGKTGAAIATLITATSVFGLRAIMRPSQEPSGAPFRAANRTTATAPTISNLRVSRWSIFEVWPIDFRKGYDSLAAMVKNELRKDPFTGTAFVFRAKKADRLKLLYWDGTGLVIAESPPGFWRALQTLTWR